jgi:hypothetical protein
MGQDQPQEGRGLQSNQNSRRRGRVAPRPWREKLDAVLVIGLCGGLTESLREQQIVAYTECLSTSPGIVFVNKKIVVERVLQTECNPGTPIAITLDFGIFINIVCKQIFGRFTHARRRRS